MFRAVSLATVVLVSPAAPAFAGPPLAGQAESSVVLTFETGAATGSVMVALYDSEASYAGGPAVARVAIAASGPVVARFSNLPAGDYAVKAFHDLDGDGQMDANPFGMPTEPYAFSNNAVGNMGPASWERARFDVSGETTQTIRIR